MGLRGQGYTSLAGLRKLGFEPVLSELNQGGRGWKQTRSSSPSTLLQTPLPPQGTCDISKPSWIRSGWAYISLRDSELTRPLLSLLFAFLRGRGLLQPPPCPPPFCPLHLLSRIRNLLPQNPFGRHLRQATRASSSPVPDVRSPLLSPFASPPFCLRPLTSLAVRSRSTVSPTCTTFSPPPPLSVFPL